MNSILRKENVSCKGEDPLFSEMLLSQDTFALSVKCVDTIPVEPKLYLSR